MLTRIVMKMLSLSLCLMLSSVGAGLCSAAVPPNAKRKKIILLLGPPGSGKGTQAVTLAKDLNIPHISTGDLFRENLRGNTPLGQKARTFIESGKLVPDEIVLDMLFKRVESKDCENGYLLDGFPRTIAQAEALSNYLKSDANLIVVNLTVPDDVITKRAEGRLTCRNCSNVHNKYFSPPKVEGKCDICHGELFQRSDDTLAVVQERLNVYRLQSKPLEDYYGTRNVLTTIDGQGDKETVYKNVKKACEAPTKPEN
jgi:adenylate kinase